MRKAFLMLLAMYATVTIHAQIAKNTVLIGGQFSLSDNDVSSNNSTKRNFNSQTINLSVGKAFRENKVFGITTSYSHSGMHYPGLGDTLSASSNGFGGDLFFRQYKNLGSKFYIYAQVSAGYFSSTEKRKNISSQVNQKTVSQQVSVGATLGVSYQVFKKLQAEISLPNLVQGYYSISKTSYPLSSNQYNKDRRSGVNVSPSNWAVLEMAKIGFRFTL